MARYLTEHRHREDSNIENAGSAHEKQQKLQSMRLQSFRNHSRESDGNELTNDIGGAKGIRTPDLFRATEARYQLRQSP